MWLFLLICLVSADRLTELTDRIGELETKLDQTNRFLEQLTRGQALWFTNVATCPEGFYPVESAEGRIPIIGSQERGAATKHSIFTDGGMRPILSDCEKAEVSENGVIEVCVHSENNPMKFNLKEALPTFTMMLCMRNNDAVGKTNPKVT